MTNRPAPAISAVAGELPDKPRSGGSVGEPAPGPDGRPVLNAASGSLQDYLIAEPKPERAAKPVAAPVATEVSGGDEAHQILRQELTAAASDLNRPLPVVPDTPKPQRRAFDQAARDYVRREIASGRLTVAEVQDSARAGVDGQVAPEATRGAA